MQAPSHNPAMTVIRSYSHLGSADLDVATLEAHDIPAELRDVAGFLLDPGNTRAHGVRLAVRTEDVELALDLIGRQSEEAKQRVEQYHSELKSWLRWFGLRVLFGAAIIVGLNRFRFETFPPALAVSFGLNFWFEIIRFIIKKVFRVGVEKQK